MTALVSLLVVLAVVVVAVGLWLVATANRLDRLHVRMDAGWAALDAALARRAVVARTVAASVLPSEEAAVLREAAEGAESAPRSEREPAENELTRLLAGLDRRRWPPPLADELSDAEHRVVIARRVYNDAVRDTLALRRRRRVRYFRLAGTARAPGYFEIAEPDLEPNTAGPAPPDRARLVLVDGAGRVLLRRAAGPPDGHWTVVGGEVAPDEEPRAAAVRELRAATGISLSASALTGPVWWRRFGVDGQRRQGTEWFFLARCDTGVPADVPGYRWWSAAELRDTGDTVCPRQLADLLLGVAGGEWDGRLRSIR